MEQATQKVIDFVINNKVKARKGFICVDGRYKAGYETAGMLARPGGNFRGDYGFISFKEKIRFNSRSDCG
jgi:hypothetical protein